MDIVNPRQVRQKRFGIRAAWFALALVAALYCGWRFIGPSPLQTNLLALLPATEVDPVAEKAVDRLANTLGDKAVFLVTSSDAAHAKAAAKQLGATLAQSHAFRSVTAVLPPFDMSAIGGLYLPYRFGLLTAGDRAALSDDTVPLSNALTQRLYNPMHGGLTTQLADDPFGWLEHFLGQLPLASSNLELEDGMLLAHRGNDTQVLVTATLPGSAYETTTQRAVLDAVSHAQAEVQHTFPDVTFDHTGAVFYAQAARAASEREVHRIGVVSLCGIGLLMLWVLRSPRLLVLGFVSTALGIVCALAVTMLVFGQLHLLTLVFGASLIGEAVDYSIQYFVVYLDGGKTWNAQCGVRLVRPALSVALATSLLGYAMLAWVPFPALKQIACFAMAGIITAFASVLWLLPSLLVRPPKHSPAHTFEVAGRMLARWQRVIGGGRTWIVAAVLLIVALPGWLQLTSDDDIHLLIQRDPALVAQENRLHDATGIDDSAQFFVVRGESPEIVLQRSEALSAKLESLSDANKLRSWQSPASFVPSIRQQNADRALLQKRLFDHPAVLRASLVNAGFRDDIADAWIARQAGASRAGITIDTWLKTPWSTPFRHLWLGEVDSDTGTRTGTHAFAAVTMPQGVTDTNEGALIATARSLPGVSFVDKARSVSALFGAYRVDSGIWLAGAMLLVLALLAVRYTLRGGIATILPVALAVGMTLAAFGYARVPLTLFNWLALMLVLGVGANYAVFLREGASRPNANLGAVWAGVMLSAATTLLSFGLLALSAMPALQGFGATLALGIAVSVVLAPMGMPLKEAA